MKKKKIYVPAIVVLLFAASFCYGGPGQTRLHDVPSLVGTLALGTTVAESPALVLVRRDGFEVRFSVQALFTGTGTLRISYQLSNDNINWSTAVEIVAAAATKIVYTYPANGVRADAGYIRLVLNETGQANPVVVTSVIRCSQ